jgi:hypothetical protein
MKGRSSPPCLLYQNKTAKWPVKTQHILKQLHVSVTLLSYEHRLMNATLM